MKKLISSLCLIAMSVGLFVAGASLSSDRSAAAGPPDGLGVQVLNVPLPVTGTVTTNITGTVPVTGTVNAKIVETPFFQSSTPTCDALNRCSVTFPAVPAGKILRVTRIHGVMFENNFDAFVALDLNDLNFGSHLFVIALHPVQAAYLGGPALSFNEATDIVFTAGQTPIVEVGSTGDFAVTGVNRLGITGVLQDAP